MQNHRVSFYLNRSYLIIALIPLLLIAGSVLIVFNNHMLDNIHRSKVEHISQIGKLVDEALHKAEDQAYILLSSSNLFELIDVNESSKTEMRNLVTIYWLISEMERTSTTNSLIDSIYIYNKRSNMLYTSDGYAGDIEEFNRLGWYSNSISDTPWSYTYEDPDKSKEQLLNMFLRKETSPFLHSFEGELIVNIHENELLTHLNAFLPSVESELTITDGNKTVLISSDSTIRDSVRNDSALKGESGYNMVEGDLIEYYYFSPGGWLYIMSQQHDAFQFALTGIIPTMIAILLLLIIFVIAASKFMTYRIYSPLDELLKQVLPSEGSSFDNEYAILDRFIHDIKHRNDKLNDFISHNRQAIKENLIKRILRGEISDGEQLKEPLNYIGFFQNKELYFAMRMSILSFGEMETNKDKMWPTWHKLILHLCELQNNDEYTCMGYSEDSHTLLMIAGTNDINLAIRISNLLIRKIQGTLNIRVNLIQGSHESEFTNLSESYGRAVELWEKKIFKDLDTVLLYDSMNSDEEETAGGPYPLEKENQILIALREFNVDSAMKHFFDFIPQGSESSLQKELLENLCLSLISHITRELDLWEYTISENLSTGFLKENMSMEQVSHWFYRYFNEVVKQIQQEDIHKSKNRELIDSHIQAHFKEPLTLEMVSDGVGISYSYMRKIFTGLFGCGFAFYLNTLRINSARSLLENTQKSMESIARETGFTSMPSFHRNFKNLTGFTPSGYRKHMKSYSSDKN